MLLFNALVAKGINEFVILLILHIGILNLLPNGNI